MKKNLAFLEVFFLFFNIFVSQDEKLALLMVDFAKVSFKIFCPIHHAVIHSMELYRSHQTSFFKENMMSHTSPSVMCQST